MKPPLTIKTLQMEAAAFAQTESGHHESTLYGVADGKTVGTYLERRFQDFLESRYSYDRGGSAKGIDFPSLNVDLKVTSAKHPQSSSPFESAQQKIRGLGYSLLILVYEKLDDHKTRTGNLQIRHAVYLDESRTADYQTTQGILDILKREGNVDDLVAFMNDRNLPIDDHRAIQLAEDLLERPPTVGYLTISNALQWRLQYQRVIESAGAINGIIRVR